ncbi:hypothetical protein BVC80_1817g27 [Macleaya cordata]|uniref:Transmembrane protein n=1 Tax=Macleaya cordata TaxID=56857 RepID=A0A200QW53_MACCD|nr:hypothetical protein BVC80_1817g27 [Macleaya cordata]
MGLQCKALAILACVIFLSINNPCKASRILEGEEESWMMKRELVLQSLPRGPPTPSGPSGCSNIPGGGGPNCPINQMNFAGNVLHHVNVYPRLDVRFGVATNQV